MLAFCFTAGGIQTGRALYERLKADFKATLKRGRAARLKQAKGAGRKLRDHEIKWLDDYDQEQEQRQESYEKSEAGKGVFGMGDEVEDRLNQK